MPGQIISGSGSSSIQINSTSEQDFPLKQTLEKAHKLGCHHLVASKDGLKLASAGFEGQCIIWNFNEGEWKEEGRITGESRFSEILAFWANFTDGNKAGETWAIALSKDGQYLASTTHDGRVNVWDTKNNGQQIQSFETKGSYGMAIDMVRR